MQELVSKIRVTEQRVARIQISAWQGRVDTFFLPDMPPFLSALQTAPASHYRIERELGAGGVATVIWHRTSSTIGIIPNASLPLAKHELRARLARSIQRPRPVPQRMQHPTT